LMGVVVHAASGRKAHGRLRENKEYNLQMQEYYMQ
jgi:hypothetical protein